MHLQQFPKKTPMSRMRFGIEFHEAGPACEKARLVRSCGSEKSFDDVDLKR